MLNNEKDSKGVYKRLPFYVSFLIAFCLFFKVNTVFGVTPPPTPTGANQYNLVVGMYEAGGKLKLTSYSSTVKYVFSDSTKTMIKALTANTLSYQTYTEASGVWTPKATVNVSAGGVIYSTQYDMTIPITTIGHYWIYTCDYPIQLNGVDTYTYVPPFLGDDNFAEYKTGSYTGLRITNPFGGTSTKIPLTSVVAHARIPISTILNTKIYPLASVLGNYRTVRQDICDMATENMQFYVNNELYEIEPIVTFDDIKDDDFYNLTITFSFMQSEPNSSILLKSVFKTGTGIDGITGAITAPYSSTINLSYVEFVPVVTKVTDGNTTTTTTTQPIGSPIIETLVINVDGSQVTTIQKDGYTETETIDKDGNITKTSDKPPVIDEVDSSSPSGFFGSLISLFGNIFKILLLPLTLVVNIINTLVSSLGSLMTNMGQIIPFLSGVFGFLPPPVIGLITACFSFLAIGVFLRTFGRK